ncbi:MAG TPA: DUF6456 domain-containing protein [Xanthobacteraceae bacterium]|nr:DUF6456 domain-containing protein [Xanthobacteraceae bacterium]
MAFVAEPPQLSEGTIDAPEIATLMAAGFLDRTPAGSLQVTAAGRVVVARRQTRNGGNEVDPFVAQHLDLAWATAVRPEGRVSVRMDQGESPLVWLARRKGRDGQPLIAPDQLLAGERLRAEFTRAQLMPRVTSNWAAPVGGSARGSGGSPATLADTVVAARQRVRWALAAVGPEFSGLLLDICCFLKGLEDVERERRWPPRSAMIVLQLGLDRLARHYGLERQASGRGHAPMRTWLAPEGDPAVDETLGG